MVMIDNDLATRSRNGDLALLLLLLSGRICSRSHLPRLAAPVGTESACSFSVPPQAHISGWCFGGRLSDGRFLRCGFIPGFTLLIGVCLRSAVCFSPSFVLSLSSSLLLFSPLYFFSCSSFHFFSLPFL